MRAAVAATGTRWFIPVLLYSAASLAAQPDHEKLAGHPDAESRLNVIDSGLRREFDAVLGRYADEIRGQSYDVVLHVERCRFIELFSYEYEYLNWIDEVYERDTRCTEKLTEQFPEHPEVMLLELERQYGEERLESGEAILAEVPRQNWTTAQSSRLYTLLASTADALGNGEAGRYATRALEFDALADVRLIASDHLIKSGETDRALELLTSPVDGHDASDGWYATSKMRMLADIDAYREVVELYSGIKDSDSGYNHADAADALRRAGSIELARAELEQSANDYSNDDERERFQFEMEYGSGAQALAAYNAWRDLGWEQDPVAINRLALFMRDASLPWRARDLLALLGIAGAVGGIGLLALIPVSFVHYRGLARRAKRSEAYSGAGWQLKHAWAAAFAWSMASLIALYTAGPLSLVAGSSAMQGVDITASQLARIAVVETFLSIVFLLPLCKTALTRDPAPWRAAWSLRKSVLAGTGIALLMRLPLFVLLASIPDELSSLITGDPVWQMLINVREEYGVIAAFWLVALAAPVVEEFLFRGVLLKAFANHISFGWANTLQAALFSAIHLNLAAAPMLFALGAIAGWAARRSGGLLAPIILHVLFNLIAAVAFLM